MSNWTAPEYDYDYTDSDAFKYILADAHRSLMTALEILHRNQADQFSEPIHTTLIQLAKVDTNGAWHRLVKKTRKDDKPTG